jgi:hypothetical protein
MLNFAESGAENNRIKGTGVDFISALLRPSRRFDSGIFGYLRVAIRLAMTLAPISTATVASEAATGT